MNSESTTNSESSSTISIDDKTTTSISNELNPVYTTTRITSDSNHQTTSM
jgi:hypothetical protein